MLHPLLLSLNSLTSVGKEIPHIFRGQFGDGRIVLADNRIKDELLALLQGQDALLDLRVARRSVRQGERVGTGG